VEIVVMAVGTVVAIIGLGIASVQVKKYFREEVAK
jgi:hypothetical protein